MTRSLITPVLLAVVALGATACGGDDPDEASSTPSESTSSAASDEPAESASSTASSPSPTDEPSESAPVPGDEGEEGGGGGGDDADDAAVVSSMQVSLNALVDPKTTPQQKADRIVGGRDLAPVFQQFQRGSGDSQLAFTVQDPEVEGRRATALVSATDRGRPFAAPARTPFVLADGEWRLERRTVCAFAEQAGVRCPPR